MGAVEDARYDGVDRRPCGKFDRATLRVYSLLFHQIDVGAVAAVLWDRFLTPSQRKVISAGLNVSQEHARSLVSFLAAMHDIGKLIPSFQSFEPSVRIRLGEDLLADMGPVVHVPHARASMHAGLHLLGELGFAVGGNDSPAVRAAQGLGGHHGRFLQLDVDGAASAHRVQATLGGPVWQDLRRRYTRLLWHLFGLDEAPDRMSVEAAVLITGLTMVADRVASQHRYWVPNADTPSFGAAEHYSHARRQAEEEVERLGLTRFALDPVPFTTAHPGLEEPNALQASVMEELPQLVAERGTGIAVVTDAMGAGKSVTALEMARIFNEHCGTQGLMWLLPATAAADQAYEVLDRYVRAHQPEYAPVTLVHHHSDLNEAYTGRRLSPADTSVLDGPPDNPFTDDPDDLAADDETESGPGTAGPDQWLRGRDNALLAQYTVSTTDQAQMAVLPVRYSALRMLALSGKTVVVDEAHALDPFSQLQLLRLLHWLGALNCPVVLLSATVPESTTTELVRAYLSGAGQTGLHGASFAPGYPGWLFADAATATAHRMSEPAQDRQRAAQRRTAHIRIRPVTYRRLEQAGRTVAPGERLAVIADTLQPVVRHGGCAVVACATVADAQDTYQYLRRTWTGPPHDLVLVHARGRRRQSTLRDLRTRLGPTGPRPACLVVVTTSLLDMSLDIDVDLMVSDLASLARLLQRLGRLGRFTRLWAGQDRRPAWWDRDSSPTLTVLNPVNSRGVTALPPGWGTVEPAVTLHETARLLLTLEKEPLVVPDDVQALVEQVHGVTSGFAAETRRLQQMAATHQTRTSRQQQLSAIHLVPPAIRVSSLADLHRQHLTTAQAATRPGILPRRLLPCYRSPDGTLTLDAAGLLPLPDQEHLSRSHLRSILEHTLPVPAAWVTRASDRHQPPESWKKHPLLADTVLLPTDSLTRESEQRFGHHWLRMDEELGLLHRKDHQ